jgi:hypothetical protein
VLRKPLGLLVFGLEKILSARQLLVDLRLWLRRGERRVRLLFPLLQRLLSFGQVLLLKLKILI